MALPWNFFKISNSPSNGKFRAIEVTSFSVDINTKRISLYTNRHYYSQDPTVNFNTELVGQAEFMPFSHCMNADNNTLCNPANGVTVTLNNGVYTDALGNVVASPIGLYDFFEPLLSQPVAMATIWGQNVVAEDSLYHTWDK